MSADRSISEKILSSAIIFIIAGSLIGPSVVFYTHGAFFLVACFLLFVSRNWRGEVIRFFSANLRLWPLLLIFAIVFAIPFLFYSGASWIGMGELKWILMLLALMMPAAALIRFKGRSVMARVGLIVLVLVLLLSAVCAGIEFTSNTNPLREFFLDEVDPIRNRANGFLRNPIPFSHALGGLLWIAVVGFSICLVKRQWKMATLAGIGMILASVGVVFSQTRGAWLAVVLVSMVAIFLIGEKPRKWWLISIGVAMVISLLILLSSSTIRDRFVSTFDSSNSSNRMRLQLWHAHIEMLKDQPFGIGYGVNKELIEPTFKELGYSVKKLHQHSHDEFIEIAVGAGWLGLILYLWITAWFFWRTWKEFRRTSLEDEPWVAFLLLSSLLIQIFINACALTDQMSTPARYFLCIAWAIAIVAPVERERAKSLAGESGA